MFVTYRPADGDEQKWEFDPDKVRASQAELIEKRAGVSFDTWHNQVRSGGVKARRVLLWHLICRTHHTLRYEDTPDFALGELLVEHSAQELLVLRDRLQKANLPEEDRQQAETALDIEITEAMVREGRVEEPEVPKAG